MAKIIRLFVLLLLATITTGPNPNAQAASSSGPIASAVSAAARSNQTVWISWEAPVRDPDTHMCCWTSVEEGNKRGWRQGRCSLEREKNGVTSIGSADNQPQILRSTFTVYLKVSTGKVTELRTFSQDCAVDTGGAQVTRVADVSPAQSIAYLRSVVRDAESGSRRHGGAAQHAVAAIAHHAGDEAIQTLISIVQDDGPAEVRGHAAFWLGHEGGDRGLDVLAELLRSESSTELADQAITGIAQNESERATSLLLTMARSHDRSHVRRQSLFWLAQKAGEKATQHLRDATDDPDEDVREMAVFAISQLPADRGVPQLIELAKSHRSRKVREKAIFWLGQSGDPRALDFIEDVLTR